MEVGNFKKKCMLFKTLERGRSLRHIQGILTPTFFTENNSWSKVTVGKKLKHPTCNGCLAQSINV